MTIVSPSRLGIIVGLKCRLRGFMQDKLFWKLLVTNLLVDVCKKKENLDSNPFAVVWRLELFFIPH